MTRVAEREVRGGNGGAVYFKMLAARCGWLDERGEHIRRHADDSSGYADIDAGLVEGDDRTAAHEQDHKRPDLRIDQIERGDEFHKSSSFGIHPS